MTERNCTCAVCMGFEPWRTDFAECMITRFIATGKAVEARTATAVGWVDHKPMPARIAEDVQDGIRTRHDAIREMNEWHGKWGWQ